jgi:peptide/nickel transport system ATP-binding protein
MEGKASDPKAWPAPFRLDGHERAAMLQIGSDHLVRAHENADISELRS